MLTATKATLTVNDAAALSGFSRNTNIRMFSSEKGVLILSRPEKMHKRKYRTMRIPRHVYERVISRLIVQQFHNIDPLLPCRAFRHFTTQVIATFAKCRYTEFVLNLYWDGGHLGYSGCCKQRNLRLSQMNSTVPRLARQRRLAHGPSHLLVVAGRCRRTDRRAVETDAALQHLYHGEVWRCA